MNIMVSSKVAFVEMKPTLKVIPQETCTFLKF